MEAFRLHLTTGSGIKSAPGPGPVARQFWGSSHPHVLGYGRPLMGPPEVLLGLFPWPPLLGFCAWGWACVARHMGCIRIATLVALCALWVLRSLLGHVPQPLNHAASPLGPPNGGCPRSNARGSALDAQHPWWIPTHHVSWHHQSWGLGAQTDGMPPPPSATLCAGKLKALIPQVRGCSGNEMSSKAQESSTSTVQRWCA